MNLPASVGDSERARLFCGLRLPDRALDTLSEWQAEHIGKAGRSPATTCTSRWPSSGTVRWRSSSRFSAHCARPPLPLARSGSCRSGYRETRSVGMLVLSDLDGAATRLAEDLQRRLEGLGVYEREQRRRGCPISRSFASGSVLGCGRRCRTWGRSVRPMPLLYHSVLRSTRSAVCRRRIVCPGRVM